MDTENEPGLWNDNKRCAVHLDRDAVAPCDACGKYLCADCVVIDGVSRYCRDCREERGGSEAVAGSSIPFEERHRLGFGQAFWKTVTGVSMAPGDTLASPRPDGKLVDAMLFCWLALLPGAIVGAITGQFALRAMRRLFGSNGSQATEMLEQISPELAKVLDQFNLDSGMGAIGFVSGIAVGPIVAIFALTLFAIVQHGFLLLAGGGRAGLDVTLRTSLYGFGVRFWEVIPGASLVTGLWALAAQAIGFSRAHRCHGFQGFVGAFGPALVGCCCFAVAVGVAIAAFGSMLGKL